MCWRWSRELKFKLSWLGLLIQKRLIFYWVFGVVFFFNSTPFKICQPAQRQVTLAEPGAAAAQGTPPALGWAPFASLQECLLDWLNFCSAWLLVPLPLPWPWDCGIWELTFSNNLSRKLHLCLSLPHEYISQLQTLLVNQSRYPHAILKGSEPTAQNSWSKVINVSESSSRDNSECHRRQPE